ncbi:Mbeg1-like protein [Magnetospirillum aberrantis]|uniref:DUF2974 domain-containing protein n=1 Tax=Magnetospirillum aberrantis SpK TaxID=908842 RepID=A0A7C9UXX3_9PROT|nr:Mbeg1-like protein [Magnetospirillum aberrantis]NFV79475.1 DUF2974 domain-containing protein [Magnetospirillum aberrantis SpK]
MPVSKDLFLSILSMDAYNRDYGAGIDGLGGEGAQIGTATLLKDSGILVDENGIRRDKSSGFYAIAYDTAYGMVISYRGTDRLFDLIPWSDKPGGDVWNSYGQGVGNSLTNAAHLAADFYQAVTGTSETDPKAGAAILTGHSMGGGLARLAA